MDRMSQDPPTLHHLMALAVGGAAVNQAMADLRQAFELDPEVAASVFGVGRGDDLRRLMDTIRLLTDQQPDDLDEVLTAVSRAMRSADATERLAELLTLESALEVRASKAVERADVAQAATLELTLSTIDDVMRHGGADDADLRDLRARILSARAGLPVSAPFEEEVNAMKVRLRGRPPAGPPTAPTVS